MKRVVCLLLVPTLCCLLACLAGTAVRGDEVIELSEAQADPDFAVQGEYVGEGTLTDGSKDKVAAQVIAQSNGGFQAVVYQGGLPGAGWKRGDERFMMEGTAAELKGRELTGKIADGKFTISDADGNEKIKLQRTERKSPTLEQKPPQDAMVIFDGKNVDHFEEGAKGHLREDGNLIAGVTIKPLPEDYKMHMEFRLSWKPEARGQGRSNSGVYLHDCYELQVLDSFGLEGRDNECAGLYSVKEPDVNMCLPPMQWQTFDMEFTAPKYDGDQKKSSARLTLKHNGVVVHENVELRGTPGRKGEGPGPRGIHLQGHGNRVFYRNIWLIKK